MRKIISSFFTLIFIYTISFAIIIGLAIILNVNILYSLVGLQLLALICIIFLAVSDKHQQTKLYWMLLVGVIPVIGLATYFWFGRIYRINPSEQKYYNQLLAKITAKQHSVNKEILAKACELNKINFLSVFKWNYLHNKIPLFIDNNSSCIFFSGSSFFQQLILDLKAAKHYIFLNFYIINDGEVFEVIRDIIIKKSQSGVKVMVIYDHAGSLYKLSLRSIKLLKSGGVQISQYSPVTRSIFRSRLNYRTHRKDVIIDNNIAYTGGVNIADEWIGLSSNLGFYNDLQIRLTGSISCVIGVFFAKDWYYSARKNVKISHIMADTPLPEPTPLIKNNNSPLNYLTVINQEPGHLISNHKEIYLSLIRKAKTKIWISSPYFIVPRDIIEALLNAAQLGIDVRILIPGKTDTLFILDLTRYYCQELFEAGVKIHELSQTFNHSKIMVIDDEIITVGTTNFDYRSFYSDKQTLVVAQNKLLIQSTHDWWDWNWSHSNQWVSSVLETKSIFYIFLLRFLKLFAPIL